MNPDHRKEEQIEKDTPLDQFATDRNDPAADADLDQLDPFCCRYVFRGGFLCHSPAQERGRENRLPDLQTLNRSGPPGIGVILHEVDGVLIFAPDDRKNRSEQL